ncbi:2-aminoadipate transaminase [Saccharomycopsis crataegensis]|uniref:2-aminoadipate transaminase n=1 Tax=Saccharomycopsis crataegensis TaxID=43959 RepID=A0AAV5QVV0_9ASCO|nr:2-aminoadipate transaminase [Saccharomycopsis crataegensis]
MSGKALSNKNAINFFPGHPSPRLLPRKQILQASTNVLFPSDDSPINNKTYLDGLQRDPLSYGTDEGSLWVREAIAAWTNKKFHISGQSGQVEPEFINLTNGASYGVLNALLQTTLAHTGYTRQAFITSPCYYLINDCFIDAGFKGKITAVEEGHDGQLDLQFLEHQLQLHEAAQNSSPESTLEIINSDKDARAWKKIYKYVIWCVPTFSNPGGMSMSLDNRMKLLELARKYDMLIISDDVYDLLDYRATAQPPLPRFDILDRQTLPNGDDDDNDGYGNVISNVSFSKLVAPGLRFGCQVTATHKLSYQLSQGGANTSGGTPSQFNANITGNLMITGELDKIIENFQKVYGERSQIMVESIKKYLPADCILQGGEGGYFMWLTFPDSLNCKKVCEEAKRRGVNLANGDNFEVDANRKGWGTTSVRLSISFLEKEDIAQGIKILGEVCHDLLK